MGARGLARGVLAAALACAAAALAPAAPAGAAAPWRPDPPAYDVGSRLNVPVTMRDGTVLRADVYFPLKAGTQRPAPGPFPVVMTQTPYGKDSGLGAAGNHLTGAFPYMVRRGYIDVVADVRGTGDSQGSWGLFDPVQARDGAQLVRWAARLPHASGRVGLYGESYLGIDQLLTAGAVGRHSPLRAIFPVVPGNDLYRDTAFFGGVPGLEFDAVFLGLTAGLNVFNPPAETAQADNPDPVDMLNVELQHLGGIAAYHLSTLITAELGGDQAYDGAYWRARNPREVLRSIARKRIPAFFVGGWYDLFQRGTPLDYSGLQNAYFGRPVGAPMRPGQPVTPRYQLLMGPWYHVTAPDGIDLERLELQWFDHWLKGEATGILRTRTPLHAYELGAGRYLDARAYPFEGTRATRFYLAPGPSGSGAPSPNDGALSRRPPAAASGADTVAFTGISSMCDRQSDQWGAGAIALATGGANPCDSDDRTLQAGPGSLTYTSPPLARDRVIAGPVDATLYATSNRPDAFFEVTLEDVAPGGRSTPLTSGGLLGSFRALDRRRSWFAPGGTPLLPYHPYTRESVKPVEPAKVTRYDVEVFPTFARIPAGHRLRVTITTSDTPHLGFTAPQLERLAGGVYQVQRNAKAASYVAVPLAAAGAYRDPCELCYPAP